MKLIYDSMILSRLQFSITNWGFEWDCISKLQKRALRIMSNDRYNAHTEPLFKIIISAEGKGYIRCAMYHYLFISKNPYNGEYIYIYKTIYITDKNVLTHYHGKKANLTTGFI